MNPADECPFCPPSIDSRVVFANDSCVAIWTGETPLGSAMVLPKAHRRTVFDLTPHEFDGTRQLLADLREFLIGEHGPDGFTVGWNVEPVGGQSVMHAHCHIVPRYHDEPYAGRGLRAWLKDPANRPPRHRAQLSENASSLEL